MTFANHLRARIRRLRFSLRTAFIAVTLVCIAIAIPIARHRQLAAIESWDAGLRNAICENLARTPAGTAIRDSASADEPAAIPGEIQIADSPRLSTEDLAPLTYWSPSVTLDVAAALETETAADLAERLIRHYESELDRHGMARKTIQLCAFGPDSTTPSSVWLSERPEFGGMVTIDVRVDEPAQTATVQIRHIARPNPSHW